jgi:anti-sigma factor (TIGR02949 family)
VPRVAVDCNDVKARIFPYVDGELGPEARSVVEAHLAGCESCSRLADLELRFQAVYTQQLRSRRAPNRVCARAKTLLAGLSPTVRSQPPRRVPSRVALAATAVLLVVLGAALAMLVDSVVRSRQSLVAFAEAAVDQHQRLTRDQLPSDIHSVSPKNAEEWFRKRLTFNISLPDLPSERLKFRGGRISHLAGVETAALGYEVEGSEVSLFIVPGDAYRQLNLKEPPRFRLITRRGYDVIVWQSQVNDVGYALVSEIGGRACVVCHTPEEIRESAATLSAHR